MYKIEKTGQEEKSFMAAIKIASAIDSEVIEIKTGIVRWTPAPKVSAKRMRRYEEHKRAREAYEKLMERK